MASSEMTPAKWKELLEEWFRVPGYCDVYVLGCFAKHITLYAQQVRALNLVAGLVATGAIFEGREVVVVGGGAAGLTAAVAAAKHKAKVLLLEEQEQVMELQRNNRQRWIHPHIYYWPDMDPEKSAADLPFLSWQADYAANVTRVIEEEWLVLRELFCIDFRPNARYVIITQTENGNVITWRDDTDTVDARRRYDAIIILAVGFGLEPQSAHQDSYWTEDNIDGNFRRSAEDQPWLVSGFGDGALTDVMRLCINQFRHAEIVRWFEGVAGIKEIKQQLLEIHSQGNLSAQFLSQKFDKLPLTSLVATLKPKLRKHGPQVFLAGTTPFVYGAESSILNRLVVRVLEQITNPDVLRVLAGPTDIENIKPSGKGFLVPVGAETRYFDRVIIRHGPKPATLESSFNAIWKACTDLNARWKNLQWQNDVTRKRLWSDDFFGPETATTAAPACIDEVAPPVGARAMAVLDPRLSQAFERYGVQAATLEVRKKIRDDGVATSEYTISGLNVSDGELIGMRFYYESTFGQVGRPVLDAAAQNAGFTWEEDDDVSSPDREDASFDTAMESTRKRVRRMAGIVRFPSPLRPSDPPLSFVFTVTVLNGDALSSWEFEQMYEPQNRIHVNGDHLTHATEYVARVVWFPIMTLKLALTLPGRSPGPAFPSLFMATHRESIPSREVVTDKVLQMYPRNGSAWQLPGAEWVRAPADVLVQTGQFANVAPQTWELTALNPPVGSCYALDWRLPSSSASTELVSIENESARFRRRLLNHREQRLRGKSNLRIQTPLKEIYTRLEHKYRKDPRERFAVSMMTYDELDHRLKLVDAVVNRGEPSQDMWDFWLPFGAGLAGACFKQQSDNPMIYFAPTPEDVRTGPEVYYPFPNRERHSVLIAFPLTHPGYSLQGRTSSFESARVRLAILDIASNSETTNLLSFKGPSGNNNFRQLAVWCNDLTQRLCTALREEIL